MDVNQQHTFLNVTGTLNTTVKMKININDQAFDGCMTDCVESIENDTSMLNYTWVNYADTYDATYEDYDDSEHLNMVIEEDFTITGNVIVTNYNGSEYVYEGEGVYDDSGSGYMADGYQMIDGTQKESRNINDMVMEAGIDTDIGDYLVVFQADDYYIEKRVDNRTKYIF